MKSRDKRFIGTAIGILTAASMSMAHAVSDKHDALSTTTYQPKVYDYIIKQTPRAQKSINHWS